MKTNFRVAIFALVVAVETALGAQNTLPKLAAANNTFAVKLLKQLAADNQSGNLFVSPYCAATALQMAANGAAGQTKTEMQQVLEMSALSSTELNAACKGPCELHNSNDTNVILITANALWYRQGTAINPGFLETNRNYFASTFQAMVGIAV